MTETREAESIAVVRASFDAFRERRRADMEVLLAKDFTFTSPYDDAIGRDAYFARCWPNGDRFRDLRIERAAAGPEGVFVTYLCTTLEGDSFRNSEHMTIRDGRITGTEVYFGAGYRDGRFVKKPEG